MLNLPADLRERLPPLGQQQHLVDPWVYARFSIPDSPQAWYVTEGDAEENDFRFFGYIVENDRAGKWGYFMLSSLRTGTLGHLVQYDSNFAPGRFIDVAIAPWYDDLQRGEADD